MWKKKIVFCTQTTQCQALVTNILVYFRPTVLKSQLKALEPITYTYTAHERYYPVPKLYIIIHIVATFSISELPETWKFCTKFLIDLLTSQTNAPHFLSNPPRKEQSYLHTSILKKNISTKFFQGQHFKSP